MSKGNNQNDQLYLILEGSLSSDQNIRKQAEQAIQNFLDNNYESFLIEVAKRLPDEQMKKEVRQMCATIIKNMVTNRNYQNKWNNIAEEKKLEIKNPLLATLASSQPEIRKATALAISHICKIELPQNKWTDIFDTLSRTCNNQNIYIQMSSVITLQYIFEEINISDIPTDKKVNILNDYSHILTKENNDPQLIIDTLNSMSSFLPFLKEIMEDNSSKINFLKLVHKFILHQDENVRRACIKVFIEFSRIYYIYLENVIDIIFEVTKTLIENDTDQNKCLSFEVWCSLGDIEDELLNNKENVNNNSNCKYYLQKYNNELSQLSLKFIEDKKGSNSDDDTTPEKYSYYMIVALSKCCNFDVIQNIMMSYISTNIQSQNEKLKYASLQVFLAILETSHKDKLLGIVKDSIVFITSILSDANNKDKFKKLAAQILRNICKHFNSYFISDKPVFDNLIKLFFELIQKSKKNICTLLIQTMLNLIKPMKTCEEENTNILSSYVQSFNSLLMQLIKNVDLLDPENNIVFFSFSLLSSISQRSARDVLEQEISTFKSIVEMFKATIEGNKFENEQIKYKYQEYISSCLSGFLQSKKSDLIITGNLFNMVIQSFEQRKDVYEEGIGLISSIAIFVEKDFEKVFEKSFANILLSTIKMYNSPSICSSSIYCLSDIIRAMEGSFSKFVDGFLPVLLIILGDNNIDRMLKPICFNILSDLFLYCPTETFKYFDSIMRVVGSALEATSQKLQQTDKETASYYISLREHLTETLNCIFVAILSDGKKTEFIPYVKNIIEYLNSVLSDKRAVTKELRKNCLGIFGDFCSNYGKDIKPILKHEILTEAIGDFEKTEKLYEEDNGKFIEWVKQNVSAVMQEI